MVYVQVYILLLPYNPTVLQGNQAFYSQCRLKFGKRNFENMLRMRMVFLWSVSKGLGYQNLPVIKVVPPRIFQF